MKSKQDYGVVLRSLRLAGIWNLESGVWSLESGSWFCIGAFDSNLTSVARKIFAHSLYFSRVFFYKFLTFNAIFKDNAAINCISVQHKKINSRQL
jgi:hypothetical protein